MRPKGQPAISFEAKGSIVGCTIWAGRNLMFSDPRVEPGNMVIPHLYPDPLVSFGSEFQVSQIVVPSLSLILDK